MGNTKLVAILSLIYVLIMVLRSLIIERHSGYVHWLSGRCPKTIWDNKYPISSFLKILSIFMLMALAFVIVLLAID